MVGESCSPFAPHSCRLVGLSTAVLGVIEQVVGMYSTPDCFQPGKEAQSTRKSGLLDAKVISVWHCTI